MSNRLRCTAGAQLARKLTRRLAGRVQTLEARVDALKDVHTKLLKITKVHESESVSAAYQGLLGWVRADRQYDYPSDLTENLTEAGAQAASAWNSFAAKNLKASGLLQALADIVASGDHGAQVARSCGAQDSASRDRARRADRRGRAWCGRQALYRPWTPTAPRWTRSVTHASRRTT